MVGPHLWQPNDQAIPVGGRGIWVRNCTDAHIGGEGSVIVGADIGVSAVPAR